MEISEDDRSDYVPRERGIESLGSNGGVLMGFHVRIWLLARIWLVGISACAAVSVCALSASPAAAEFGVSKWEAGTCKVTSCSDSGSSSAFYTQAAGHPNFGITDFKFNSAKAGSAEVPEGQVKDVRVDLPPGLAVNPEATGRCTEAELEKSECPAESRVGEDEATGTGFGLATVVEKFPVYNMVTKPGEPARFGVEVKSTALTLLGLGGLIYLEGGISWHHEAELPSGENSGVPSGDYHEYFEIKEIQKQPEVVESKLIFWGVPHEYNSAAPDRAFLTLPSTCSSRPVTYLHVDSYEDPGHFLKYENQTPVTASGCGSLEFKPTISLKPETTQSDAPDGPGVALHVPQYTEQPGRPDSPDLESAEVALPEGMTLDPAAAHGLQACTGEQIGIGTGNPIACPAESQIGTVTVDAPGIPNGALVGGIYLGEQESQEPESGREFRIFLAAEAAQYGVGIRLEGQVRANAATGRLTAAFADTPQVPFENFILNFKTGPRAPLANPLSCGPASTTSSLTPYTGAAAASPSSSFTVDADGHGGACAAPLPFSLAQATTVQDQAGGAPTAGAYSSYSVNEARADGEQYLSKISTTLPAGLLGAIPSISLCGEPQATAGTCSASSQIGTATVLAGAGPEPYSFSGPVYLTGPDGASPYGLSVVVPAVAGPYDLGTVVTRGAIDVDPHTARLTVSATLPSIVEGVPLRLKTLNIAVDREKFLFDPTNCGSLSTETSLTSIFNAAQSLSSPFQVGGCGALAFSPKLSATASSDPKTSHLTGASLDVDIAQGPHQANIREVFVELPSRLAARDGTLREACTEAVFNSDLAGCPPASIVGHATVTTPVLPGKLEGPAYLVSHGGAAFPDLELILAGDGVSVILDGQTHIGGTVTSSRFSAIPDVPISSFNLSLPAGSYSALGPIGSLCKGPLVMPTTITAQSGAKITQSTQIAVAGCVSARSREKARSKQLKVMRQRVENHTAILEVRVPGAGRLSAGGVYLKEALKRVQKAGAVTLKVSLSSRGLRVLHRRQRLAVRIRLKFRPSKQGPTSSASMTVIFKR
jgi:hypothetical protein